MKNLIKLILTTAILSSFAFGCSSTATVTKTVSLQDYETITEKDMYNHLSFISSDELQGRNTPSPFLNVAAKYIATRIESYGLKPLNADGSYYQKVPLDATQMSGIMELNSDENQMMYELGGSFNANTRLGVGDFSGEMVFVGFGLSAPKMDWDDLKDIDVKGKIVVLLDADFDEESKLSGRQVNTLRSRKAIKDGAVGFIHVMSPNAEKRYVDNGGKFNIAERFSYSGNEDPKTPREAKYFNITVPSSLAQELLGIPSEELSAMVRRIQSGKQVPGKEISGNTVSVSLKSKHRIEYTQNVVGMIEGTDPVLKNEYVLYGAHYDHVGTRNGVVYNGADDDGSGTTGQLEIAQAYMNNPQKRSIVFVWHCGEEKGLWGATHFSGNPMVPLEKVSAQINMDMIGRNDNNSIFVIGAGRISTELEILNEEVNTKYIGMELDYKYDDVKDKNRYYFRSDHYMYAQYGVPVIFYFNDVHADYHRPTDTIEKIDFNKMMKISRMAFLLGKEIANRDDMLPLDADPKVTVRGKKK